jgi:hypothetical protein
MVRAALPLFITSHALTLPLNFVLSLRIPMLRHGVPILKSMSTGEENRRTLAAYLFTQFLKILDDLVKKAGKALVITSLIITFTDASARAVPLRKDVPKWMEKIDLSFTRTTARGPRFLSSFPNLRCLHLDHCPTLKQEKDLFKKLVEGEKFNALEEVHYLSPDASVAMSVPCSSLITCVGSSRSLE